MTFAILWIWPPCWISVINTGSICVLCKLTLGNSFDCGHTSIEETASRLAEGPSHTTIMAYHQLWHWSHGIQDVMPVSVLQLHSVMSSCIGQNLLLAPQSFWYFTIWVWQWSFSANAMLLFTAVLFSVQTLSMTFAMQQSDWLKTTVCFRKLMEVISYIKSLNLLCLQCGNNHKKHNTTVCKLVP